MRTYGFKPGSLTFIAALLAGLGFITPAAAQLQPYLVDLNSRTATTLGPMGGISTHAAAINDAGQVAGSSDRGAFITGPDGMGIRDLGPWASPWDINNAGQVVGGNIFFPPPTGESHAFITGPDGVGIRDLGTLGGDFSWADAVNDIGQVVGTSSTASRGTRAFITGPDGGSMRELEAFGEIFGASVRFWDINDAGQVVGGILPPGGDSFFRPFITGPNGVGVRTLGDAWGEATGINNAGQVVGSMGPHAFITGSNGVDVKELGTLGGDYSSAWDINDAGQVVGISSITADGSLHAFVTGPNGDGMTDLNSLVDLPDGVVLTEAREINNAGQVIAYPASPQIPEPKIYVMIIAGLGLIALIERRKRLLL
ncbi:putative HAF family extracellular repeat protein [Nitrosospira sp. Nsp2]|uniref:HAF repeat-containing protein n=1 Tax=Nitrosospira sp. Nsp2 TaxID=136548 RepID=UPI000D314FC5|nr:HAF repeat-containing protein [Nitrosospira sp. Nsp2]PTR16036.1 putative HAF family extracellular repeat protein [Nitrosospira sp. Nsp2]